MPAPLYPPVTPGYSRWTQSSLETYLKCGVLSRFIREERHRWSTVSMAIGTSMHEAVAEDSILLAKGGARPNFEAFLEFAIHVLEREFDTTEMDEAASERARAKSIYLRRAAAQWFRDLRRADDAKIVAVEKPIVTRWKKSKIELAGTIDLIIEELVGDLKTGRKWSANDVETSRQLSLYAILYRGVFGQYPKGVFVDNVYGFAKGRPGSERTFGWRGEPHARAFRETVLAANAAREKGVELPAPAGSWYCSKKWCPFFRKCKHTTGVTT